MKIPACEDGPTDLPKAYLSNLYHVLPHSFFSCHTSFFLSSHTLISFLPQYIYTFPIPLHREGLPWIFTRCLLLLIFVISVQLSPHHHLQPPPHTYPHPHPPLSHPHTPLSYDPSIEHCLSVRHQSLIQSIVNRVTGSHDKEMW